MTITSIGYHTFTIYLKLTIAAARELYKLFLDCKEIYLDDSNSTSIYKNFYYHKKYKGLKWTLRFSRSSPSYMKNYVPEYMRDSFGDIEDTPCSIRATITPKQLIGIQDYVTAANSSCLNEVINAFNCEASKISPILKDFNSYSLNRIDYCINFKLDDFETNAYPEQYMTLIKHSDIPNHFEEFKIDNAISHRKTSLPDSYYLKNNSVHINIYDKEAQLKKKYPGTPNIHESFNIIRFEIQYLYLKTQYMQRQIKDCQGLENMMVQMQSDDVCKKILISYFYKTIGRGDYYTIDGARAKVKAMNYRRDKEERLLDTLKLVNQSRGIYKAKSHLSGDELREFSRSLKDLGDIGVNPITIPREWSIKHLPNLMTAYLTLIGAEEI